MPVGLGPWELVILLLIVVIVFGAGKLADIGGALGKGLKDFKAAAADEPAATVVRAPALRSAASNEDRCPSCGTTNPAGQPFCGHCGMRLAPPTSPTA
jgi:sec-independent protein translocase protein TatA